ncbi:hypothetical protein [Nannocystis sp. SCPEA4]|uniref:hypothetical protein n=1 Tax=Nannocystis sp. SCPEA4 TaxID=2996787 RepID=UPI002271F44A|nr:hypothetical protein [Nannocystis sp. SCPEA4]MCY1062798.1 hypothetical protein [Nannocystis sp. SCPEA4]
MLHATLPRRSTSVRPTLSRSALAALLACLPGCGEPAEPPQDDTGSSTAGPATTGELTTSSTADDSTAAPTTTAPTTSSTGDTSTGDTSTGDTSTGDASTTGPIGCTKNVVLMGYWPPTNEMLRPWSTDPTKNPEGWIGADWKGHGYDVYSFFPEFPPDGDPTNDDIGDDGAVGSPDHDLRVDYQATSADFWRLVDTYQPVILVTTSRGGDIGWELEALEGGHGMDNPGDPAMDWASDNYEAVHFPTQATIEPRSWDAITTYRQGNTLPSQLPLEAIAAATEPLGLTSVVVDQETSGNFLSGFLGLHGVYYNQQAPHNVAAGHIHVGFGLPVADASVLIEATLDAVLQAHPADEVECP